MRIFYYFNMLAMVVLYFFLRIHNCAFVYLKYTFHFFQLSINLVLAKGKTNKRANEFLWLSYNLTVTSSVAIPIAYAIMCRPYRIGYKLFYSSIRRVCKKEKKVAFSNSARTYEASTDTDVKRK